MTYHRLSSRNVSPTPLMAKLHLKLSRIVSRHDQLKLSFNHLRAQINIGLLEAEDVFSSLAIPLMKLVGLKSAEMADEGRLSTFVMKTSSNAQDECEETIRVDTHKSTSTAKSEHDLHRLESAEMAEEGRSSTFFMKTSSNAQDECEETIRVDTHKSTSTAKSERDLLGLEENYTNNAIMASKDLMNIQKVQLIQLVKLLKQVEGCVNSSKTSMFRTIDDHKIRIHTFLHKAVNYISVVQQSSHDRHAFNITLKLLKAIYDNVLEVLSSVEGGVDNLINSLTEEMCEPMSAYVKSIKAEMTTGTCPRLLVALEDMRRVARDGRVELEEARKKVRVSEESKLEALSMLRESEERAKRMRQYMDCFINYKNESTGHYAKNKEDQSRDDKFLWELLNKKHTCQQSESPSGLKQLLPVITSTKPHKTTGQPSTDRSYRSPTQAYGKLKTQPLGSLLPLGSSPSVTTKQVLSRKRVAR